MVYKIKSFALVLLCLLFVNTSIAQKRISISPQELESVLAYEDTYPEEDLIIYFKRVEISFVKNSKGVGVVKKEQLTLVSLTDYATLTYPVAYDSESSINSYRVFDKNGKENRTVTRFLKDEYLTQDDLFHTDYRIKSYDLTFPLKGSAFTVETEKEYEDVKYFTSQYLSTPYPVISGEIIINQPDWLDLSIKEFNFEGDQIDVKIEAARVGKKITYSYKELTPEYDEKNSLGPSFLYPHLLFVANSYTIRGQQNHLIANTADLFSWYSSLVKQVDQNPSFFTEFVESLIKDASTDDERIEQIYYWVQDNIRYIAFEDGIAGFKPDSPKNVFDKRYGDCKGMAILTKTMLKAAGYDARLAWLGTDRLAYNYDIPSLAVDNHMICALVIDNNTYFLDGTERFNRFGDYAARIANRDVLIEDESISGYKRLVIPINERSTNIDAFYYNLRIEDERIVGTGKRTMKGETRASFQYLFDATGADDQDKLLHRFLSNGKKNSRVFNVMPFNSNNRNTDIEIDFEYELSNAISEFDAVYYVDLNFLGTLLPSIDSKRKVPFVFPYKERQLVTKRLQIPQGMILQKVPENISDENEILEISINHNLVDGVLEIVYFVQIKNRIIAVDDFNLYNKTIALIKENLDQQLEIK